MILHENRLPADDSHEISCLIYYFLKSGKICKRDLLQNIGGALRIIKYDNGLILFHSAKHWIVIRDSNIQLYHYYIVI